MKVLVRKSFLKDVKRIKDTQLKLKIGMFIKELQNYSSLQEIKNLKKLSGYDKFYRIRFGDYRIGLRFEDETLILERFLPRKDIYKVFP